MRLASREKISYKPSKIKYHIALLTLTLIFAFSTVSSTLFEKKAWSLFQKETLSAFKDHRYNDALSLIRRQEEPWPSIAFTIFPPSLLQIFRPSLSIGLLVPILDVLRLVNDRKLEGAREVMRIFTNDKRIKDLPTAGLALAAFDKANSTFDAVRSAETLINNNQSKIADLRAGHDSLFLTYSSISKNFRDLLGLSNVTTIKRIDDAVFYENGVLKNAPRIDEIPGEPETLKDLKEILTAANAEIKYSGQAGADAFRQKLTAIQSKGKELKNKVDEVLNKELEFEKENKTATDSINELGGKIENEIRAIFSKILPYEMGISTT